MAKNLKCDICLQFIAPNDNYVKVEDYYKGKLALTGYYHNSCYLARINRTKQLDQTTKSMVEKASKLIDNFLGKDEDKGYTVYKK